MSSIIQWARERIAARKLKRRWWGRAAGCSTTTIGAVLLRDKFRCAYCGLKKEPADLHLDHVITRRDGGRTVAENLVVSCVRCNLCRGNGPVPDKARAEVERRLALPVDREAGRELGDELYPWAPARREDNIRRKKESRARLRREGEGLAGAAFPFGKLDRVA